ncbi:F-box domain-containing protein [Entamoeba marina]
MKHTKTLSTLENVYLKNVMFYLDSLQDVFHFEMVSKSCSIAIQTAFINTYKLSLTVSFEKILRIFPSLQTFYCTNCLKKMLKKQSTLLPLIEVGKWQVTKMNFNNVFTTLWFASKVRKLTINCNNKQVLDNLKSYTQLNTISIHKGRFDGFDLSLIFDVPTLKKCYLYFLCRSTAELLNIFKLITNFNCSYIFVIGVIGNVFNYEEAREAAKTNNFQLFFSTYCNDLKIGEFLPCPSPHSFNYISDTEPVPIYSSELVKKHGFSHLRYDFMSNDGAVLSDIATSNFLFDLDIRNYPNHIIFPQQLTSLSISFQSNLHSTIDLSRLHLKSLQLTGNIPKNCLIVNIAYLESFSIRDSASGIRFVNGDEQLEHFIVTAKMKNVYIYQTIFDFVLQIQKEDGKSAPIKDFRVFNIWDNELKLCQMSNTGLDLDFSGLSYDRYTFDNVKLNSLIFNGNISTLQLVMSSAKLIEVNQLDTLKNKKSYISLLKYKSIKILSSKPSLIKHHQVIEN